MKKMVRIAVVVAKFNSEITGSLLKCCVDELHRQGVKNSSIKIFWIPGAYELPYMANLLAKSRKYDAVICLGCVIKGETSHDLFVSMWASIGIGQVSLNTGVPVLFGVLTPKSEAQALKRSRPGPLNRGKEVAEAAIEMIQIKRTVK